MNYLVFEKKWLGKRVDYDGVFKYQCVDLIKQYLAEGFGLKPGAWGNAIDYWYRPKAFVLEEFLKVAATSVKAGDIVVLETNVSPIVRGKQPGHIGLATGRANGSSVEILEQNGSTGGGSGTGGDVIRKRYVSKARIAGLLRSKPQHPYAKYVGGQLFLKPSDPDYGMYGRNSDRRLGGINTLPEGEWYTIRGTSERPNRVVVRSASLGKGQPGNLVDCPVAPANRPTATYPDVQFK